MIIVDDHGHDNSMAVIQNQIAEHPRKSMVRFAKTEQNSGPGFARNIGLQMAQGEYVAFVDSDDWVETDMYERLYETAVLHSADICCSDVFMENPIQSKQRIQANIAVQSGFFSEESKRNFLANYKDLFWSYIYRRDFLNTHSITFPSEKGVEDVYFLPCCIVCAERIAYLNKALYHYAYYPNSLVHSRNEKRYKDKLSVLQGLLDFAKKHHFYDNYKRELEYIYIKKGYLMATVNYIINAQRPQVKILREIYKDLTTIFPKYSTNAWYKKHLFLRILVIFLHRLPRVACVVFYPILRLFASEKV